MGTEPKKRILVLNYEFPPLGGGAGNATYYLLKEFAKNSKLSAGWRIDLVTSSVDKFRTEQFASNITIHFLDIGKKGNLHYQSNLDLLKYSWRAYRYCRKLKTQKKFDLIHAFFGIPCGYIAMKLGLPYIVSLRGSDVPFYNRRFYWLDKLIFKRLSRKIWQRARKVVANSQGLRSLALQTLPNQKIDVIYNGVDVDEFKPAERSESSKILKLISTGRLIERKGYKYLIEAIADLKEIQLTLVGDGNIKEELKTLAKEKRSNVVFLGKKNHKEIVNLLQQADIFCLPSLNEGMSNSILEAMACGLPIIATDTGGSLELIEGNGYIVSKASVIELKKAILSYVNNINLLYSQSLISRELAEKMSWGEVAEQYSGIYSI